MSATGEHTPASLVQPTSTGTVVDVTVTVQARTESEVFPDREKHKEVDASLILLNVVKRSIESTEPLEPRVRLTDITIAID